jgi:hypothetical protein
MLGRLLVYPAGDDPFLTQLCPVTTYLNWIKAAQLNAGPLFRDISRWEQINDNPPHPDSLNTILKTLLINDDWSVWIEFLAIQCAKT